MPTNQTPGPSRPQTPPKSRSKRHATNLRGRGRPLTRPARRVAGLCASALVALALAACSSSGTPSTTTTLPSPSASAASIRHAYEVLFDLANPALSPKLAVIQDGSVLKSAMETALKSALAKTAGGATLSKIVIEKGAACTDEFLPSPCAKVVYDILTPTKAVVLRNAGGLALYQHGHWLVGKTTICTLLELESSGAVPHGC